MLRARILCHMNAWDKTANVRFAETQRVGQVRIARLDSPEDMAGYWSYVGTEILGIAEDEPTLNLEGFTMRTSRGRVPARGAPRGGPHAGLRSRAHAHARS